MGLGLLQSVSALKEQMIGNNLSAAEVEALTDLSARLQNCLRSQRPAALAQHVGHRQVRTTFSPSEAHRLDALRGVHPLSVYVRQRVEAVLDGLPLPEGPGVTDRDPAGRIRVVFWLPEERVAEIDQLRGSLPRSSWVRDVVVRLTRGG